MIKGEVIIDLNVGNKSTRKRINETPSLAGFKVIDLNRICVYAHYYDNENKPFYIGQGTIRRAYQFTKSSRNNNWHNKVKDISKVHVKILYIDIDYNKSIEIEKELIKQYGRLDNNTGCLVNENDGGANSQIGENNYFYGKRYIGNDNPNYGNKYELNNNSIPIVQLDIVGRKIKEWASAAQAEEIGKFSAGCISHCCNGKRTIHKGYQWKYLKDYDSTKDNSYKPGKTNDRIYIAVNLTTNEVIIFNNIKEAIKYGFTRSKVSAVVTGRNKSHKGFKFIDFFNLPLEDRIELYDELNINS